MTRSIARDKDETHLIGHEMIIIGYDDNAKVVDAEGKTHTGLLILRNSWGKNAGDKGNFYMTYEFFQIYADEIQKINLASASR